MIEQNVRDVVGRIAAAARRVGRDPGSVQLIAVSKTVGPAGMIDAAEAGVRAFGENYVQEASKKIPEVRAACSSPVAFHCIGHLQRNKAKDAVRLFDTIQTVDRIELAHELEKAAVAVGRRPSVLIQVNTSGEESKSGIAPEAARGLAERLMGFSALDLRGLMCIGRYVDESADEHHRRTEFRLLANLRSDIASAIGRELPDLSMGMSHDFELAIEEGATLVRVGTMIFGERN